MVVLTAFIVAESELNAISIVSAPSFARITLPLSATDTDTPAESIFMDLPSETLNTFPESVPP